MRSKQKDLDHPILEKPWEYSIVGVDFRRTLDNSAESFIDLVLERDSVIRRLRFFRPVDIRLDEGFPASPGLCILDVSTHGLEGIRVRVEDFEASGGGLRFWARDVVDLDEYEKTVVP